MPGHVTQSEPTAHKQTVNMKLRQAPLRAAYLETPDKALIVDHARTRSDLTPATNPLYGAIECGDPGRTVLEIALHEGVGGRSDLPVPGELFSAAIAGCLDSVIRVVANFLGIRLSELEVSVRCEVDLRGTLKMAPEAPVGFKSILIEAHMVAEGDVPEAHLDMILNAAEESCVVLQSIRTAPEIVVRRG